MEDDELDEDDGEAAAAVPPPQLQSEVELAAYDGQIVEVASTQRVVVLSPACPCPFNEVKACRGSIAAACTPPVGKKSHEEEESAMAVTTMEEGNTEERV